LELLRCLQYSGKYILSYKGGKIDLTSDDLEVSYDAGKDHVMSEKEGMIVFIDTNRNDDLATKGLLRDLARNLQQLRKECGYSPTDVLANAYIANLEDEEISILSKLKDELMFLVRVKSVVLLKQSIEKANSKIIDIDGRKLKISLE
jgi:isoleucyl-tRNA synthetase